MARFLNTWGRRSFALTRCDRCQDKLPIGCVRPDGDNPALMVCGPCYDYIDPWKLPPPRPDNYVIPGATPDEVIPLSDYVPPDPTPEPDYDLDLTRSSAGVYSGDTLIRTLWNERAFEGELNASIWDGLDDNGDVAPSGEYTLKVLDASGVEWEWLGVVGNNSAQPPDEHWSPMDTVLSMAITSAGKAYVACGYDEARVGSHAFDITAPLVPHEVLPTTFRITGPAVYFTATDGTRAYFAGVGAQPNSSAGTRSAVWAVTVADDAAYTFSSGASFQGYNGGQTIASAISIILADPLCKPTGLAVHSTGNNFVYVSRSAMDRIDVLDKLTGALVTTITSLTAPRALRCMGGSNLWVAYELAGNKVVSRFTVDGTTGAFTLINTLTGFSDPLAIAVTPDNATIRIADGGTSQQIKSYSVNTGALESTYGQATGYALGPEVTKDKLWFYNNQSITLGSPSLGVYGAPWAMLEHQPDGKLWVTDAGQRRCMRLNTSGAEITTFDTEIAWIGSNYSACMNMTDPRQILSDYLEYEIDLTKEPTEAGWWTLKYNWNYGLLPQYNAGQLRHYRFTTMSNGRRYVQSRDLVVGGIHLHELDLTLGAVRATGVTATLGPTGIVKAGDLRTINSPAAGNPIIMKERALTGFDGSNNPTYASEVTVLTTPNVTAEDTTPRSVVVDVAPWEATTGGVIPVWDPRYQHTGWHLSGIDSGTGEYRWKSMPSTPSNFAIGFPQWPGDGYFTIYTVSSAGNHLYQSGSNIITGYHGEGAAGFAQVNKWFHFHESGLMIQNFGPVLEGDGKDQRGMAGNSSRGGIAMLDGVLYLCHNDESYGAGVHVWRCSNLDTVTLLDRAITWDADSYVTPAADPNNLLDGLPYNTTLTTGTAGWTRYPLVDDLTSSGSGPYWRVGTNFIEPSPFEVPDLNLQFLLASDEGYVIRTLPSGLGAAWTLSALVWLNRGDTGTSVSVPWGYCYTEVLDASDRVIARWKAHDYSPTSLFGIYGNNQAIATFASLAELDEVINSAHVRLTIRTDILGNVLFKYGDYAEISTTPLDPLADAAAPAKFRVHFDVPTVGGGYSRRINFKELRIT